MDQPVGVEGIAAQFCGLETYDPLVYRAKVSPDADAVVEVASGERLTFSELDRLVGKIGALLSNEVKASVAPPHVAYLGRNSIAQLATCLACQRAGLVFIPLNWRLGAAELRPIIEDGDPALFIHDVEFASVLAEAVRDGVQVLTVEGENGLLARAGKLGAVAAASFEAARTCIMLYTSGTTGKPKGVLLTRHNAFASAVNFAMVGEITEASVTLCDLPFFHTIGLVAIARTTVMMGGLLIIADRFHPDRALSLLGDPELGVTHYFAVPQMAATLRASPVWNPRALEALQAIFIGGAPLSPALIAEFLEHGIPLVNGYGMSEVGTAIHMPLDREAIARHPGSVGYPAPLLEIRIVNATGENVEDGEVGEIWLRGPSVTPGYWNKPEETALAFVDGWFRTGDLGRRDSGGVIFVPDRLKDMYITGGENVFPAEIEAVIGAHAKVQDVAVIGVPDAKWGECGLALVVAVAAETPSAEEILTFCAERLASYKRPHRILFVETIPRTASGKAQKNLLRQTYASTQNPPALPVETGMQE
ncbi:AMP-binding protein [Rhizobium sp. AAP43]|uniref:AMP-binding protein n=1 Tax=Rhizobium sp. AAP43 TaxID=1523420 RepID=UPI0006B90A67|nr:AMP-binding protein [Rhizobium sp. AAP43]KPF44604.1 feruloyl-CoA synthetase [Rhizobium sp. AAP43]